MKKGKLVLVSSLLLLGAGIRLSVAENMDPSDDASHVHAENLGWINAQPLGEGGPGMQVDDFALTGWMWGENIGWISLSCENTESCDVVDYRVTNDGSGTLAGSAWGENLGWIQFAPSTAGVFIDPSSGQFSGHAWSENGGWLAFSLRTFWRCDPAPKPPSGSPVLSLQHSGDEVLLSWSALPGASAYDVVFGRLDTLRNSGGDFSVSVSDCLADNRSATAMTVTSKSDHAEWFLVRGLNCGGIGTYDATGPGQVASRDAGIDAAAATCP